MLFVIFILGTLFAASIAFLAMMRTDAEIISAEKEEFKTEMIVGGLIDQISLGAMQSVMGWNNDELVPYYSAADADDPEYNPDAQPRYASIPAVDHLVSSIEPYNPGTGVMEWFAAADPYRAWNGKPDVELNTSLNRFEPRVPSSHPLRIRPLDASALSTPYFYSFDQWDDTTTRHGGLTDADGDGVPDATLFRLSLLGGGQADWSTWGACDGTFGTMGGPPSFSIDNSIYATPLPCGMDSAGTAFPNSLRRDVAASLRDPTEYVDTDARFDRSNDLYFGLRQIQNGGLVNLFASHWTLVDNLLGLDGIGAPAANGLASLPRESMTEQLLRHRGLLSPPSLPVPTDPLSTLYRSLFGAMSNANGDLQWMPLVHEPGIPDPDGYSNIFNLDYANRWMNPWRWNDLANSAGLGTTLNYDVHHLATTVSTDDLFMRSGSYNGGLLTAAPAYPFLINTITTPAMENPGGMPQPVQYVNQDGESALDLYGTDPNFSYDFTTGFVTGDRSFYEIDFTTQTVRPRVPIRLSVDNATSEYGPRRDARGNLLDPRAGRLQFGLHSIGNVNVSLNPAFPAQGLTRREVLTVLDYFTVMLRNIWSLGIAGPDGQAGTADDNPNDNKIHDLAAQLTANFIDFADYDGGIPGGGSLNPGGPADLPTMVQAYRPAGNGPVFYGIEKQPYISEIYLGSDSTQLAVELTNPHNVPIDLAPSSATGVPLPYAIDFLPAGGGAATSLVNFSVSAQNIIQPGNNRYRYVATDYGAPEALPGANRSADTLAALPGMLAAGDKIRLIRVINGVTVICDEVQIPSDGALEESNFAIAGIPWTLQRDNNPNHVGGWRVTVPRYSAVTGTNTLGGPIGVQHPNVAPVHATTDDRGLESAYPTTGSMLLLMRSANSATAPATAARVAGPASPWANPAAIDNGHMPVFDQTQLAQQNWRGVTGAQPMDGTTLLSVPWGQLVFDYFTALPFDNDFDPATTSPPLAARPVEPGNNTAETNVFDGIDDDSDGVVDDSGYAAWIAYLRGNQPRVDLGYRVHGRININAAPWKVLQGLPLLPPKALPIYKHLWMAPAAGTPYPLMEWTDRIVYGGNAGLLDQAGVASVPMGEYSFTTATAGGPYADQLGAARARGLVAYRELREIYDPFTWPPTWTTGNYNVLAPGGGYRVRRHASPAPEFIHLTSQRHTAGYLTVGELANVHNDGTGSATGFAPDAAHQMDNGQSNAAAINKNYLYAIAPLVALGDWVTVKGHTFTAYGTLTGHGDMDVDEFRDKIQRFEVVYDRSNVLISNDPEERPNIIYKVREPLGEISR